MAEEGLKKTRNELIHIGCPIPFEIETFLKELESLMDMAFGNNEMRLNWMKKLSDAQIVLPRLIHATAYVSPTAEVEAGTVVLPLAIINTDCRIQSGCIINCGSIVDHGCVIEEGVHISPGTVIKAENRIPRATKIEAGEVVPLRAYPL